MLNLNVPFSKSSLAEPQWKVRNINRHFFAFLYLVPNVAKCNSNLRDNEKESGCD